MLPLRPIARWIAAAILAVVALAAPATALAHAGHGHGHHAAAVPAPALAAAAPASADAARIRAVTAARDGATEPAALRSGDADADGAGGAQAPCRCGAACCAPGILAASAGPTPPLRGHARLLPHDVPAAAGLGPESPVEPPRPLA